MGMGGNRVSVPQVTTEQAELLVPPVSRINCTIGGAVTPKTGATVYVYAAMDPGFDYPNPISSLPFPVTGVVFEDGRLGIWLPANIRVHVGLNLRIIVPGCAEWTGRALTPSTKPGQIELTEPETGQIYAIELKAGSNSFRQRPSPEPRGPLTLPLCGSCPTPTSYDKDLAALWPGGVPQTRDYLRAATWNIEIPGLPMVWGGSSKQPQRFLAYFYNRYPQEFQQKWLYQNALRGMTHVVLSWPDAMVSGQSLKDFVADIDTIKTWVKYVRVMLGAKGITQKDMNLVQWQNYAIPLFSALKGHADEYSVWEFDLWNLSTGNTPVDVWNFLADQAHAQGAGCWEHFSPEHGAWWEGHEAGQWNQAVHTDGLAYQSDPKSDIGELQARLVDFLRDIGPKKVQLFEPGTPSIEFDNAHPTSDEASANSYCGICTRGQTKVWGFGEDTRWPSGQVI